MKVSIRQGVFETNSSSVHSCSITTKDNYNKFCKGSVWYKQDGDSYADEDVAIEFNLNYIKKEYKLNDEDFAKFSEVYKKEKDFYSAFEAIEQEFEQWDIDPYDIYLNDDTYWEYHEYEDWHHTFKDTAGVDMVAWGYCGHD